MDTHGDRAEKDKRHPTMQKAQQELTRIGAGDVKIGLDEEFEPKFGELVQVTIEGAYWHLVPEHFVEILQDVPDRAGADAVKAAIETKATLVWHGPAQGPGREGQP
jgi:hypothetical protein